MPHCMFISILKQSLIPFIKDIFPDDHHFVQDNDPKLHQSWGVVLLLAALHQSLGVVLLLAALH